MRLKNDNWIKLFFLIPLVVSAVDIASASGVAHAQPSIENLKWPLDNSLLYLGILIWVYKKYIHKELGKKADKMQSFLNTSKKMINTAEDHLKEVIEVRDNLDAEKMKIIAEYKSEGEKTGLQIIKNAHTQVEFIEDNVLRQINSELNQAKNDIRTEILQEAVKLVKQRIQSELSYEQDKQLRSQAVDYLI